jgi:hypothetical protein
VRCKFLRVGKPVSTLIKENSMRALLAVSLIALFAPAANATPIRYDFSLSLVQAVGTLPGNGSTNGSGYVVFDTDLAVLATGGKLGDLNTPLPTIDLSFDWLGQHFDALSGTLSTVTFDGFGNPLAWDIDNIVPRNACVNNFRCVQWGTDDFSLLASPGGGGSALLTQTGVYGVAIGSVSWVRAELKSVPEPGIFGLMTISLVGLWLARRKVRQV